MDPNAVRFDDLLVKIGGFGRYQKLLIFAMVLFLMGNTWQYYFTNFVVGKMDHWCKLPDIPDGFNETMIKEIMIPKTLNEFGKEVFSQCEMYDHNITDISRNINAHIWNRTHIIWPQNVTRVSCQYGWEYDHSEFHSTIVSQYDLVCDNDWMYTLPSTFFIIGLSIGSFTSGFIADRFGRKLTIILFTIVKLISITGAAFAPYFWMFLALRCVVGVATLGTYVTYWVLVFEAMPPGYRSHFSCFAALGKILDISLPAVANFVRNHIYLQLVSIGFVIPGLICILFIPESPRWLLSQERIDDFLTVVRKIARFNKSPDLENLGIIKPMVKTEIKTTEIKTAVGTKVKQNGISVLDLLRLPKLRKRTLSIWFLWFSYCFALFAMLLNIGTLVPGNIYLNTTLVMCVADIPSFITIYFALFKFSRRNTIVFFFLLNGLCSIIMIPLLKTGIPILVTILAVIGTVALKTLLNVCNLYTGEVFPTSARNVGFGSASSIGRIGALIAPQIPLLKTFWFGLPYIFLAIFPIVAGILAYFLPETKGKHLPETLEEAEKFGTHEYDNGPTDPEKCSSEEIHKEKL
ncbi:unnamed protein product [Owenia fusiformis]|uniref:Uncharacterized protein n=1 Tax=Owenia fusiformis TaxID=6347 RepID=A0A8J1Y3S6_OWEFU|nr:unnamed protein product [Owenia fusiformis]